MGFRRESLWDFEGDANEIPEGVLMGLGRKSLWDFMGIFRDSKMSPFGIPNRILLQFRCESF